MSQNLLENINWIAGPVLQLAIVFFLLKRGLKDRFPYFFHYTCYQLVSAVGLYGVYHFVPAKYFYAYWVSTALSVLLGFCVIHEVFDYIVKPYTGLRDLAAFMFRWSSSLLIVICGVVGLSTNSSAAQDLMTAVLTLERTVRLMQCGMLLFIAMCSQNLGISWRSFASGVSLGFGLFAASDLIIASLQAHFGPTWMQFTSLLRSSLYNIAVFIWFGYSALPEPAREQISESYQPIFDRWNQAALLLMPQPPQLAVEHTYLSDIERAVENVLARNRK